jgi:hypothetical protein
MSQAMVTCSRPDTQERLQRALIAGALGALSSGALIYGVTNDREQAVAAAAVGGAFGLMFW